VIYILDWYFLSFLLNIELELIIYRNVMSIITMNHFEYYVMMEYSVMFSDACNSTQYLDLYMNFMIMDIGWNVSEMARCQILDTILP
jgi:hypothetical protein